MRGNVRARDPHPFLVVLYSTLRMGLQGSGFFPSLGCFPEIEQTDDTLLCQFSPLTLLSTLRFSLSSCLLVLYWGFLFFSPPPQKLHFSMQPRARRGAATIGCSSERGETHAETGTCKEGVMNAGNFGPVFRQI